jgi:hypothetical protein
MRADRVTCEAVLQECMFEDRLIGAHAEQAAAVSWPCWGAECSKQGGGARHQGQSLPAGSQHHRCTLPVHLQLGYIPFAGNVQRKLLQLLVF